MDEERLIKAILHYQQNLERYIDRKDETKMLHCIEKLHRLPITVAHLERTGVGRVVNSIRKMKGIRSAPKDAAKELVDRWKQMVTDEDCNESEEEAPSRETEHDDDDDDDEEEDEEDDEDDERDLSDEDRLQIYDDDAGGGNEKIDEEETRNIGVRHSSHERYQSGRESSRDWDEYCDRSRQETRETRVVKHRTPNQMDDDSPPEPICEQQPTIETSHNNDSDDGEPSHRRKHRKSSKSHSHKEDKSSKERRRSRSRDRHNGDSDTAKSKSSKHSKHSHKSSSSTTSRQHHRKHEKSTVKSPEKKASPPPVSKKRPAEAATITHHSPKKSKPAATVTSLDDGIDCESGASFAEALGMMGNFDGQSKVAPPQKEKEKSKKETTENKQQQQRRRHKDNKHREEGGDEMPDALRSLPTHSKLDDATVISNLLPQISTNYKPMAHVEQAKRAALCLAGDDEALTKLMYSKTQRTKVYSGVKTFYGKVPSLFDSCIRVLQDNVDSLGYTGGVPYSILKPVLERLNADQLYTMEFYNSNLMEDSDELWQLHCQREFKHQHRQEMETWREMFIRCLHEREAKLKFLTANIKLAQDKCVPVRQTKLAYVDSFIKPPRNVAKKQTKNGVAPTLKPSAKLSQLALAGGADKIAVPNPGVQRANSGSSSGGSSGSWTNSTGSTANSAKPKKAPLMAKTLQLMKGRYRR